MDFYPRFSWAMPKAFSEAIASCHFEEGDTFYDTKDAYQSSWAIGRSSVEHSIQVRYPPRQRTATGQKTKAGKKESVFSRNWSSEVHIDVFRNLKRLSHAPIRTTQGRLYTALWKGDLSVLSMDTAEPSMPYMLRDVTKNLDHTYETAIALSEGSISFIMARDLVNDVSLNKYKKVHSCLGKHLKKHPTILSPREAGLRNHAMIAPTIDVVFFHVDGLCKEELHDILKESLYKPTDATKNECFRIRTHGLIVDGMEAVI